MAFSLVKQVSMVAGAMLLIIQVLPPVQAATPERPTTPVRMAAASLADQLNLTDAQKQKIRGILSTRNQQIVKTLTPAQRTKLQRDLKSGKKLPQAMKDLKLNREQKKQIGTIVQQSNQAIRDTLDSKQRQQMETYLKQRRTEGGSPIE